jgi:Domain of unknown function (DUF4112)
MFLFQRRNKEEDDGDDGETAKDGSLPPVDPSTIVGGKNSGGNLRRAAAAAAGGEDSMQPQHRVAIASIHNGAERSSADNGKNLPILRDSLNPAAPDPNEPRRTMPQLTSQEERAHEALKRIQYWMDEMPICGFDGVGLDPVLGLVLPLAGDFGSALVSLAFVARAGTGLPCRRCSAGMQPNFELLPVKSGSPNSVRSTRGK